MNEPTAPSAAPFGRRPWRRKGLLLALTAAAVLLIGFVVVNGYRFSAAKEELADALAETDRLDPGWRFEDLEAQRQLPPAAQNAALQVFTVQTALPRLWHVRPAGPQGEDRGWVDDVLRNLQPERQLDELQVRRLREDLGRAGPALEQARKLADMPEGRYSIAWTADVLSTPCPWLDALIWTQRLLQLDVLLHNQEVNPDAALISARALLNLGRSSGDEPFLLGPANRNGGRYDAAWAVERTLAQGQPSEPALAALQEAVAREEAVPLLLAHFRGERAVMHVFLTRVHEGQHRLSQLDCVPKRGVSAHIETWFGGPDALRLHARFLRGMNEAVEIAKLPLEQQSRRFRAWRRQWGHVDKVGDALRLDSRAEDGLLTVHARLRCTQVALAAERYRRQHGTWPQALGDLVPDYLRAVPLDPFDGQPLRYRRTDRGVVLWSVGEDGRDDGGNPKPPDESRPRHVVFTLWDVGHRRQPPKPPEDR